MKQAVLVVVAAVLTVLAWFFNPVLVQAAEVVCWGGERLGFDNGILLDWWQWDISTTSSEKERFVSCR